MITITAPAAPPRAGREHFGRVLRSEFTKFRTVPGWTIGLAIAGLLMVALGVLTGVGSTSSYSPGPGEPDVVGHPFIPVGPDGQPVTDQFSFAHRTLSGDGSITVRLDSLRGSRTSPNHGAEPAAVEPWAKAGMIIKDGLDQGDNYAAIMVTGAHGIRLQHDFTGDIAGPPIIPTPVWLRLTRTGDTVTGESSVDGTTWTTVGAVPVALGHDVEAGLFATSPTTPTVTQSLGGGGSVTVNATASVTAGFDSVTTAGGWAGGPWIGSVVGDDPQVQPSNVFQQDAGRVTMTGSGDIAPNTGLASGAAERVLIGGFGTLIVTAILAVLFITTEYRRGLMLTTLSATPRRGAVLAAKALVVGVLTFAVASAAGGLTLPIGRALLVGNGNFVVPTSTWTDVRVVLGTALVLALTAVLALAIGTIMRRSAAAVLVVVLVVVLPYLLATAAVLPAGPSDWLLRLTPAAAFAVQQTSIAYPQVDGAFTPAFGYFPLGAAGGLLVLLLWTGAAMTTAAILFRRRAA